MCWFEGVRVCGNDVCGADCCCFYVVHAFCGTDYILESLGLFALSLQFFDGCFGTLGEEILPTEDLLLL